MSIYVYVSTDITYEQGVCLTPKYWLGLKYWSKIHVGESKSGKQPIVMEKEKPPSRI